MRVMPTRLIAERARQIRAHARRLGDGGASAVRKLGPLVAAATRIRNSGSEFGLRWQEALETGGVVVGDEVRISADISAVCTTPGADAAAA